MGEQVCSIFRLGFPVFPSFFLSFPSFFFYFYTRQRQRMVSNTRNNSGNAFDINCKECKGRRFNTQWIECLCRDGAQRWKYTTLDLSKSGPHPFRPLGPRGLTTVKHRRGHPLRPRRSCAGVLRPPWSGEFNEGLMGMGRGWLLGIVCWVGHWA